jgi:hypothetical protein
MGISTKPSPKRATLAPRVADAAGKTLPIQVDVHGTAVEGDRLVIRVLDTNFRQESGLQAFPLERFDASERHFQRVAEAETGTPGERDGEERREGSRAHNGRDYHLGLSFYLAACTISDALLNTAVIMDGWSEETQRA